MRKDRRSRDAHGATALRSSTFGAGPRRPYFELHTDCQTPGLSMSGTDMDGQPDSQTNRWLCTTCTVIAGSHTYTPTDVNAYMHVYVCIYILTFIFIYLYTCTHTHTYACVYICSMRLSIPRDAALSYRWVTACHVIPCCIVSVPYWLQHVKL